MAIRIGIGFGGWPFATDDPEHLWRYVDACEALNVDSLWLSDRIVSARLNVEPIVTLAFVAARTKKLKFGTSVLALPLRHPTVLAKEIATLDFLSGGRTLPAIGLGADDEAEYEACGTTRAVRGSRTEEAVQVMRLLWTQDHVTFHGQHFTLNDVTVQPKPVFPPDGLPPIWVGGRSEAAMRRAARIGDGWLVSQATPEEVKVGIEKIKVWAAEYDHDIEEDHYGTLVNFCFADSRAQAERLAAPYLLRRRPDVDYHAFSALGDPAEFVELMARYVAAGVEKFVARPACPPERMHEQLDLLGRGVISRYQGVSGIA